MVVLNFILIFVLYLYYHGITYALPFTIKDIDIDDSFNDSTVSFETIENNKKQLESLINSRENKEIFLQLQNSGQRIL